MMEILLLLQKYNFKVGTMKQKMKKHIYNYFLANHREVLLRLLLLLTFVVLCIDVVGSYVNGYIAMSLFEGLLILLFVYLYVSIPTRVSLLVASRIVVGLLSGLIIVSLTLPGYNHEFVLFALSVVPVFIFCLLGHKEGAKWVIVTNVGVFLNLLNAYVGWFDMMFSTSILWEVSLAYMAVSYGHYVIEKTREYHEQSREQLLKEKTLLLKEVHHRAKNNLQTIMGLLESQSLRVQSPECRTVLSSQNHRLQSMSLLHEYLSFSDDFSTVAMHDYLHQIITLLGMGTKHEYVVDIDKFSLNMSVATNLALFVNEAVSNAIEHAYSADQRGKIVVSCKVSDQICHLLIEDFGGGFVDVRENSLGLILMEDLSQIFENGSYQVDTDTGVKITAKLNMKEKKYDLT